MAITSKFLRDIEAEARPIIERQMNDAKIIAGLRDVVAAAGGDWGALKALIKARVEDDNDEAGEGKRVRKIREKADCIVAYDDMLGSNMNEKNFSASQSYAEAKGRELVGKSHHLGTTPKSSNPKASSAKTSDLATTPSELIDTQEQPETDDEGSRPESQVGRDSAPDASEHDASARPIHQDHDADRDGLVCGSGPAGDETGTIVAAPLSPSVAPPADTVAEPQAPQPATVSIPNPQPTCDGAGKAGDVPPPSSPAALSDADVPAFLKPEQRKSAADYRPHCKHPDNCGSSNPTGYCYQCRRAMEAASETEAV